MTSDSDDPRTLAAARPSMNGDRLDARIVVHRESFDLDIELSIEPNTTAALLGPNGAGKSTTIAVLAGLTPLSTATPRSASGRRAHDVPRSPTPAADPEDTPIDPHVRIGGRTLDHPTAGIFVPPEQRRVGVVFQDHLLFDHLSVLDNVAFGPRSAGASRRASRELAADWLTALDLDDLAGRRPTRLSGGQAQRVALARALASTPDILLFDEPLAALDVETRSSLRRVLRRHLDGFVGPRLLITHDPADAFLLADRLHIIEAGRITQVGTPGEIRRHPATPYIAALAGTNLFAGRASRGSVLLDNHEHVFTIADTSIDGDVLLAVHPRSVSLHTLRPEGSQRNTWSSLVALVEPMGDTVRVTLDLPVPIAIDVTPAAVESLGLRPGVPVWAAVKATEITTSPA